MITTPSAAGNDRLSRYGADRSHQPTLTKGGPKNGVRPAREWNERTGCDTRYGKPDFGLGYFETYPQARRGQPAADWEPAWWDWNLKEADWEMEDSRGGVPVFVAGLSASLSQAIVTPSAATWAAQLNDSHGFVEVTDDCQRFERVAYSEEVLVGRTLQQQGESLGRFVVETYEALYAAGPPPGLAGGG